MTIPRSAQAKENYHVFCEIVRQLTKAGTDHTLFGPFEDGDAEVRVGPRAVVYELGYLTFKVLDVMPAVTGHCAPRDAAAWAKWLRTGHAVV